MMCHGDNAMDTSAAASKRDSSMAIFDAATAIASWTLPLINILIEHDLPIFKTLSRPFSPSIKEPDKAERIRECLLSLKPIRHLANCRLTLQTRSQSPRSVGSHVRRLRARGVPKSTLPKRILGHLSQCRLIISDTAALFHFWRLVSITSKNSWLRHSLPVPPPETSGSVPPRFCPGAP